MQESRSTTHNGQKPTDLLQKAQELTQSYQNMTNHCLQKGQGKWLLSYFCKPTNLKEDAIKQAILYTARRNINWYHIFSKATWQPVSRVLMIIFFDLLIPLLGIYLKKKKKNLNTDKVLFTNKFIMALFLRTKKYKYATYLIM